MTGASRAATIVAATWAICSSAILVVAWPPLALASRILTGGAGARRLSLRGGGSVFAREGVKVTSRPRDLGSGDEWTWFAR
jgi:hypothetical protein